MNLCFSTLGCFEKSLGDILDIAQKYYIPAIELRGIDGKIDNTEIRVFSEAMTGDTLHRFQKSGISPIVLGTSCAFHNADRYERAISEGEAAIEIAERLSIPNIRVFGDKLLSGSTERITEGLLRLCSHTRKTNVLLEVHGDLNTVEALSPILEKMSGLNNFGLIWDIEHTHKTYGDRWETFYSAVKPYIKHVHIKDRSDISNQLTLIGEGDIPISHITERLLKDGYDGYFSLEWEKKWHPELPEITAALDSFVKVMNGVYGNGR